MKRVILNKVEIDYHEDRPYKDEADKRSQQFRELAKVINENAKITEEALNLLLDNFKK